MHAYRHNRVILYTQNIRDEMADIKVTTDRALSVLSQSVNAAILPYVSRVLTLGEGYSTKIGKGPVTTYLANYPT